MANKDNFKYHFTSNENVYFRPVFRTFRAKGTHSLTPATGV
jgi:hypothetical protein